MRLPDQPDHGGPETLHEASRDPLEAAAIVAHYLVDSVAVIVGTTARLREQGDALSEPARAAQLALVETHALHVAAVLAGLARGQPVEALVAIMAALDDAPELALPPNRAKVPRVLPDGDGGEVRPRSALVEGLGLDIDYRGGPPAA